MGTRSTITFIAKYGNKEIPFVKIMQMFDGYIDGKGRELAEWLYDKTMVNGLHRDEINVANGVGCLIAQYISDFKTEPGDLYIIPLDDKDEHYDYNYKVIVKEVYETCFVNDITTIIVTIRDDDKPIFKGTPKELLNFKESDE